MGGSVDGFAAQTLDGAVDGAVVDGVADVVVEVFEEMSTAWAGTCATNTKAAVMAAHQVQRWCDRPDANLIRR